MISKPDKNKLRLKRHKRIRGKISGTAERPRLSVFRSNKNIYAQLIDDVEGVTLASASTNDKNISAEGSKMEQAAEVGKARSGYLYHGRVQALADAARENGLEF